MSCRTRELSPRQSCVQEGVGVRTARLGLGGREFRLRACRLRELPLSCLLRGPHDDLRNRAVLWQQQLGFCSRTGTVGDAKYRHASREGEFLENVI